MNITTFQKRINDGVNELNYEQRIIFTSKCAILGLPFLGHSGSFNQWENQQEKHLFAVFKATFVSLVSTYKSPNNSTYNNVKVAYEDSKRTNADTPFGKAIFASVRAVKAQTAYNPTIEASASARTIYFAAKDYFLHEKEFDNFINKIFEILKFIKEQTPSKENLIPVYGDLWYAFQNALKKADCIYWANLFERFFTNGINVDTKDIINILSIPEPIEAQGAAEVGKYLDKLEKEGAERLNEARLIILGEKGAGKTSIARRLVNSYAEMPNDSESTAGVDTAIWKIKDKNISIRIWDFAGHTISHAVHQFFLSERCLYLIVYDGRSESRNRLNYWLDQMKNYGGSSKAVILINKRDNHKTKIPINNLKEKYPILKHYEFSVKHDLECLNTFRNQLISYINENPSWNIKKIPTNTYMIKEELEKLFYNCENGKGKEFIEKEKFNEIATKYNITDTHNLLGHLHALGVSLWYKNITDINTLILNPEWISHGIYKIINWVNNTPKYSVSKNDFKMVFEDEAERFPTNKHKLLYKLMLYYQLAYETDIERSLVIPHLLNEDKPETLPNFEISESLLCRYKTSIPLPPDTISKFIVRHSQEIDNNTVWRYGVVLKYQNNTTALVREDDRIISVSIKGEYKTEYLRILRKTLNSIFETYKSDKPTLEYHVQRIGEIPEEVSEKDDIWLSDQKIYNHYLSSRPYYDDTSNKDIPLTQYIINYHINAQNLIMGGQGNNLTLSSINNTFNFNDCNITLQGNLNELAQDLRLEDNIEEAEQIETAAKALEMAEQLTDKEEVKKKGVLNKIKRVLDACEDENSKLHKTIKGINSGVGIAQDIAKGYNDIAQWIGLPQVPKPFLKKE